MTLHFAYGSNMSRPHMRTRCPYASALGVAMLAGWRFVVVPGGYGSIEPCAHSAVHGVLWRLTARDLATINAYENVAGGLYAQRMLPVRLGARRRTAMVYIARRHGQGTPRPGYIDLVVAAAREWQLPERYIASLKRWSPSGWAGTPRKDVGEFG
jgi:hypothetical protein